MGKAIISNKIYMDLPPNKKEIFDTLTYKIITNEGNHKYEKVELIRNYRMITPSVLAIPQGRRDLIPEDYQIIDKRVVEFADFPDPKFDLFEEQLPVYEAVEDSAIINALVGWGKTFTALWLARKLGQKTLVVTHTVPLRSQWEKEVEKLYGFEPSIIGDGKFDTSQPITVANVQTLVKGLNELEKTFGTIILDEMHHVPASTFSTVITSSHARYRLGLSGTLKRKDGKHVMFKDYFGSNVYTPPQSNTLAPTIEFIKTGVPLPPGATWGDKITNLLGEDDYINFISILALTRANKGHKVLIIADRTDFLERVNKILQDRSVLIIGPTKDRDAELNKIENGEADIICGARQIFAEGISCNALSCVILAVPIANPPDSSLLEQIIGRIMRKHSNKLQPLVVDIQFSGHTENRQNSERIALYMQKGWAFSG